MFFLFFFCFFLHAFTKLVIVQKKRTFIGFFVEIMIHSWKSIFSVICVYYGRFTPGQRAHLRRAKRSAIGRMETRLQRAITQARLTTDASRPDKELAYGEQNVRPLAKLKPAYGE